jgi:hypothetical protein
MIIDKNHKLFDKVEVADFIGTIIPYAYYYNTKTKLVKMYVVGEQGSKKSIITDGKNFADTTIKHVSVSFVLKGSKLINKKTKKEVKV